ncbi:MAG: hypothetical protein JO006_03460 [Paucibacter sp.]|nr:hypothetical protein [Roseateles sp.]
MQAQQELSQNGERPSRATVPIFTPWTCFEDQDPAASNGLTSDQNAFCDQRFRWFVAEVVASEMPWLLPIVQAAGGLISAFPGALEVILPDGTRIPVPQLAAHLTMLPWHTVGESMN